VQYEATSADCVDESAPDPDQCEQDVGFAVMKITLDDYYIGHPRRAFIRFDLDNALAGKTVTSVTLRLQVTDGPFADSPGSGEVWRVQSFSEADLFGNMPATIGANALAPDQGAITQGQVLDWSLPTNLVTPNGSVYLGLLPTVVDGAYYWNEKGVGPPLLVVDYQ